MKEKIIICVISLLVGAVIATGAFFVYTQATTCNNTNNNQTMQMPGGNPPSMPNGQNEQNGQPPELPNGNNSENGQPPEMPNNNTQNDSNTQKSNN